MKAKLPRALPFLLLPLLTAPGAAHAHLVSSRFGEYYSGLLHPLTTLVHLVPWLALAVFAVVQGPGFARRTLPVFPLAVGIGVLLGAGNGGVPSVLALNIISFVVLGGLVAVSQPVPNSAGLAVVVVFALCHGFANGDVDLADGSLTLYLAGVVSAAYLVVTLTAGASTALKEQTVWGPIALRTFGSWILAAGLIYGGFELMSFTRA